MVASPPVRGGQPLGRSVIGASRGLLVRGRPQVPLQLDTRGRRGLHGVGGLVGMLLIACLPRHRHGGDDGLCTGRAWPARRRPRVVGWGVAFAVTCWCLGHTTHPCSGGAEPGALRPGHIVHGETAYERMAPSVHSPACSVGGPPRPSRMRRQTRRWTPRGGSRSGRADAASHHDVTFVRAGGSVRKSTADAGEYAPSRWRRTARPGVVVQRMPSPAEPCDVQVDLVDQSSSRR